MYNEACTQYYYRTPKLLYNEKIGKKFNYINKSKINNNSKRQFKNQENDNFKISVISENTKIEGDTEENKYNGKKAIVVGAGPSGTTVSAFLVNNGFKVKLYERLESPELTKIKRKRSVIIVLQNRTTEILKKINIDLPKINGGYKNGLHQYYNSIFYDENGKIIKIPDDIRKTEDFVIGERIDIIRTLISGIMQYYKDKIEFNFNCECESVDFDEQIVRFKNGENEIIEEKYDLLIGSDGVNSKVAEELQKYDKNFKITKKQSKKAYCCIRDLSPIEKDDGISKAIHPGTLIIPNIKEIELNGKKIKPRVSLFQRESGTINVLLTDLKEQIEFIKENGKEWYDGVIFNIFPKKWEKEFLNQLIEAEVSSIGNIVRASSFIGPKTILTGDAAHGVTPIAGQGANMAIIDAKYIDMAFKKEKDIDSAILAYNELRYEEIQCLQDLQESLYSIMIQRTFKEKIWILYRFINFGLFIIGNKLLPNYFKENIYISVFDGEISPIYGLKIVKAQGTIVLLFTSILTMILINNIINY